jgi:hypothetical protein
MHIASANDRDTEICRTQGRRGVNMLKRFARTLDAGRRMLKLDSQLDDIKLNQGRILSELNAHKDSRRINDYEFKVFSQGGEDGIIQFLVSRIEIKNRTFIEFGTEDFRESNCRFLLVGSNWSGFVVDGSPRNMERLRRSRFYWRHSLQSKAAFITRENINSILSESGFDRELGILSVDIDGVDYFVLQELHVWQPSILIVEYNAIFGKGRAVSVPYDPSFLRTRKHFSNLYYGASLAAFVHLLAGRGYALVGVNSAGNNAFFVRKDLLNDRVRQISLDEGFRESCFREGRDEKNRLTFSSGRARREMIADLPLVDVLSGEELRVRDLGE